MSKARWKQIPRFLTISNMERQEQPLVLQTQATMPTIRPNIASAVAPASRLTVDEMMILSKRRLMYGARQRYRQGD
jgi:hypothetical protein